MSKRVDISKEIEDNELRRYSLSVVSGQEKIVIKNLKERVKKADLEDDITDFLLPIVPEVEYKNGQKKMKQKKLYPGYVFIESRMNEKIWYILRNTPGVRLIVGAEVRPIPLTNREYENIVKHIKEKKRKADRLSPYEKGDIVKIKEGEFEGMKWKVTSIDPDNMTLSADIEMLGRVTSVNISFDKIELLE